MAAHEDRRTRKTKKAMTDALARLLLEKPLNSISVKEIADIADINRGTFYLHYRDVYDMAEQIQIEIFGKFAEIVEMYVHEKKNDELFPMMVAVFNLLKENSELAKVLIGKNGDAGFVDKLKTIIREKCFSNIRTVFNFKTAWRYVGLSKTFGKRLRCLQYRSQLHLCFGSFRNCHRSKT